METDTLDITGNVLKTSSVFPSEEKLKAVLSSFLGKQVQEVPLYSAKKVNGRRLYDYARKKETVKLPKQEIEIKELELLEETDHIARIRCFVSKGTYIRSLIRDICHACNTVGTMKELERTHQGMFSLKEAYSLEEIARGDYKLLTYEDCFDYEEYSLNEEEYKRVCNGNQLFLSKTKDYLLLNYHQEKVFLYHYVIDSYRPLLNLTSH